MKRSIPAFVCGLVINLCLGIVAFVLFSLFSVIVGLALGLGSEVTPFVSFINVFCGVCVVTSIVGVVGSFFCLKKRKIGGIIMSVASLADVALSVMLLVACFTSATEESPVEPLTVVVLLAAMVVSVIPTVVALKRKKSYIERPIVDKV